MMIHLIICYLPGRWRRRWRLILLPGDSSISVRRRVLRRCVDRRRGRRRRWVTGRSGSTGFLQSRFEWLGMKWWLFRTLCSHPIWRRSKRKKKKFIIVKLHENTITIGSNMHPDRQPVCPHVRRRGVTIDTMSAKLTGCWRQSSLTVAIVDTLFRNVVVLEIGKIVTDARQHVGRRRGHGGWC